MIRKKKKVQDLGLGSPSRKGQKLRKCSLAFAVCPGEMRSSPRPSLSYKRGGSFGKFYTPEFSRLFHRISGAANLPCRGSVLHLKIFLIVLFFSGLKPRRNPPRPQQQCIRNTKWGKAEGEISPSPHPPIPDLNVFSPKPELLSIEVSAYVLI